MENQKLKDLYYKYNLSKDDFFKHKHYVIIVRKGIEKIQAIEKMRISYEVVNCERDYCVVKAIVLDDNGNTELETFGSALKGDYQNGNTQSWYVMEIAEKRAMSRAVLKMTGFYEQGVFSEDESEDFKKHKINEPVKNF